MYLLDRLLIRSYLKAYIVCLVSLLSLYVVIDLFTNVDDFTSRNKGLGPILTHIGTYYGYRISRIFDQLCEVIVLLAAMFTIAWVQRNNELVPLLSAGVSTRRVVRPVLIAACLMLGLSVVNQEFVSPRIARYLLNDRDDPNAEKDIPVTGAYEPNDIHLEGFMASRKNQVVRQFSCLIPPSVAGNLVTLNAKEAYYVPPNGERRSGGWLLTGTQPAELEGWDSPVLEMIDPGKFFLHTKRVDFETLTRSRNWFMFASTLSVFGELNRSGSTRLAPMAVLFHMRLTRPILGLVLVFLGLSVILRDQNRNVFISAGLCLILCAVFFTACFACKQLGDMDYLSPALAAWLPVLTFGPMAFVLFDAVHT
jgi:lipopolysaccharide export system permease protein